MKILVTGSKGFVGKNLIETLKNIKEGKDKSFDLSFEIEDIYECDIDTAKEELKEYTNKCDFVVNLAGINRPKDNKEFYEGNSSFIETLCNLLKENNNKCPILVSSSIQVNDRDNDYAKSKKLGEDYLKEFSKENGNKVYIYRFPNLFGKWCKPNYNSVIATWCYNYANDLNIQVNDETVVLPLAYIDDVVKEIINCLNNNPYYDSNNKYYSIKTIHNKSLKEIKELLDSFKETNNTFVVNQMPNNSFEKKLYSTYLSYLPINKAKYELKMNVDERGSFTELIKTVNNGQISVNISKPGITKGNHWHHSKWELFIVVKGKALIQERNIITNELIEIEVSGDKIEAVYMLPGYSHNIINLSKTEDLVTVMFANECLDSKKPDTFFEEV